LLVRRFQANIQLIEATSKDYLTVQNMAQFYVYDASRECGFALSENGLYEPKNYKRYFEDPTKKAFLLKLTNEIVGFVLLNSVGSDVKTNWKIDQFFILGKFQKQGIGKQIAYKIFDKYSGIMEVSIIPVNKAALLFWRKIIAEYTNQSYICETKLLNYG